MTRIKVKIGSKKDFKELAKLDFSNTCNKMFDISYTDNNIAVSEVDLQKPIVNKSENYVDEILEDMIPKTEDKNFVPLVVFSNNMPAGYLMAKWDKWPNGKVLVVEGILVANQFAGKGLAKALVGGTIETAKQNKECRGIHVELDTTKYQANKLFLRMGFKFAGTKFYIYSKEDPRKYSKEAVFFYYKT